MIKSENSIRKTNIQGACLGDDSLKPLSLPSNPHCKIPQNKENKTGNTNLLNNLETDCFLKNREVSCAKISDKNPYKKK